MVRALLVLAMSAAAAGSAAAAPFAFDVRKPAWFGGREIETAAQIPGFAGGSGPNGPSAALPDITAYLVGNIFPGRPFAPDVIANCPFPFCPLTVPAHDDVFSAFSSTPFDAFGLWVVPTDAALGGPEVLVRTVGPGLPPSLVPKPLAYAVDLGSGFLPLTDAATVQAGVAAGLLETVDAGWGGVAILIPAPGAVALFGLGALAVLGRRVRPQAASARSASASACWSVHIRA